MCEHEWITTRAVYRTITPGGYKNHEINRLVCIYCLKTRDEVLLEHQLSAANARVAELEKLFVDLTPGGSEFVGSPQNCIDWVKSRREDDRKALCDIAVRLREANERADKQCDELLALNEGILKKAEEIEAECKRLRVCGNCRHFSTGYTEDLCAKPSRYGGTTRQSTCNDWEMIW